MNKTSFRMRVKKSKMILFFDKKKIILQTQTIEIIARR